MACTYVKNGDHDKAITDYTAAIQINPKDGTTFYARGYSYWQKGDKAKADADFAQAEKLGYKAKPGNGLVELFMRIVRRRRRKGKGEG